MAPSIALVVLDTVRDDTFNEYFDWIEGQEFSNVLSPSHWTVPVHAALFTGAYPSEIGVNAAYPSLDTTQATLAEKLSSVGYKCRGYSANGNISPSANFDRGFEQFTAKGYHQNTDKEIFDWTAFVTESSGGLQRYPRAVIECIQSECHTIPSLLEGFQRKFDDIRRGGSPDLTAEKVLNYVENANFTDQEFLFINLMDAHPAYTPPPEYQTTEPDSLNSVDAIEAVLNDGKEVDSDHIKQAYEDSVRYLSDMYKKIFTKLETEFDYIITLSDHGETFGEHGIYGHIPSLVPEIVRVPLIITGDVSSNTVTTPVNLIDINQTISDLADISDPPRGQNILIDPDPNPTLTEAHGISKWQRQSLRTRDITDTKLNLIDQLRRGISIDDYYGYESLFDGWVDIGDEVSNPKSILDEIVLSFDTQEGRTKEISDDIRNQLSDMGYI